MSSAEATASRERALALIAKVDRTQAESRDPEMVARAQDAIRASEAARGLNRRMETGAAPAARTALAAPKAMPNWQRYVDRQLATLGECIVKVDEGVTEGIAQARHVRLLRQAETDRRLADLEARLAKLEGNGHG